MGFTKIHGFPGFGSKDLSNPRDDKTKNDVMVNLYPLECPKLTILPNKLKIQGNRSKPTTDPADTSPPGAEVDPLISGNHEVLVLMTSGLHKQSSGAGMQTQMVALSKLGN